jgi:hypothetical protein
MTSARNTSLSIEYRLWQILAQAGWFTSVTGELLVADPTNPLAFGSADIKQPWVFLDADAKNASRDRVNVYLDGTLVNPMSYKINFLTGQVIFPSAPTGAVTADFDYFVAGVIENFEEGDDQVVAKILEVITLPVVAYGLSGFSGTGFAIGSTALDRSYPLTIDALCQDDGQKKDLGDDLVRYLACIPMIDFTTHSPLNADRDVDTEFDFDGQKLGYLRPSGFGLSFPNPRKGGSDKEKHRALVTVNVKNVV